MLEGLAAFLLALVVGTLVEYWGHRLMHRWLFRKRHARHHKEGFGQGWLGEFFDYFTGTIPILWLGFLYSVAAGIGFVAGGAAYAAFAAYSHELQHERPELCFWLRQPVHHLHHHHHLWHHNFGISFDFWDHVFGTWKQLEWQPPARPRTFRSYFQINWLGGAWRRPQTDAGTGPASGRREPAVPSAQQPAHAGRSPAAADVPPAPGAGESPCPEGPSPGMVRADLPPSSSAS